MKLPKYLRRYWRKIFTNLPFTWAMLFLLGSGALLTNTHTDNLAPHWLNRLGFAPADVWFLRWERLFTSALVTSGGWVFWQALGMVALAVGAAEWLAGTKRAIATFWGVHLATLLLESLLVALPLHQLGVAGGTALLVARDVGPSAGYFGCLGLACARFPRQRWSQVAGVLIIFSLIWTLFQPPRPGQDNIVKLFADLAHLIAFPLGWLSNYGLPEKIWKRRLVQSGRLN